MNRETPPRIRLLMLFAIICVRGSLPVHAEEPPASATASPPVATASPAPITDPAQVAAHYRQVLARPEFQETEPPDVNARFKDLLSQWFMRFGARLGEFKYASRMPAFESLLMSVLVVFSITGLFYVMARLTRRRGGMEAEPSVGAPGPKTFRPPEFYDDEIRRAIGAGDWHGAWLAAWRQFLSRLENRRLVEADRTRTNREYLAQLRAQTLPASALALLTGMVDGYDRTIYGSQAIGEPDWNLFHRQIDEAALLLHLEEKSASGPTQSGAS